jgi:hypothetical protein
MSDETLKNARVEDAASPAPRRRADAMHAGLRQAGVLVSVGLLVEVLTIFWSHPTAFLAFAFIGGTLLLAGVARYLWAVLGAPAAAATGGGDRPAEAVTSPS